MGKHGRPRDAGTNFDDQWHSSKRSAEAKNTGADGRISELKQAVSQHRQDQEARKRASREMGEREDQPRKDS